MSEEKQETSTLATLVQKNQEIFRDKTSKYFYLKLAYILLFEKRKTIINIFCIFKEDFTTPSIIAKLHKIIEQLRMLQSRGVSFERQRKAEALSSLKHLLYWGFCIPTTCCYQYIFGKGERKPRIRIYQWFMCPGLGTTHLIKNYWVHMMLAGLFSHCTSVPIYIVDDSVVYFGSCPHVTMLAWGGLQKYTCKCWIVTFMLDFHIIILGIRTKQLTFIKQKLLIPLR